MNKPMTKRERIAVLERRLREEEAHQIHNYHFGSAALGAANMAKMQGSSVIITVSGLGGRIIVGPTAILNGLSDETIAALKADMARSFEYATELKPEGVKSCT